MNTYKLGTPCKTQEMKKKKTPHKFKESFMTGFSPTDHEVVTSLKQVLKHCSKQTFNETSATRFLLFGSSNGTDSASTPSITTFPSKDPFSLIFLVSARVSIPKKS